MKTTVNGKVTLKDVYEAVNRVEDKLDSRINGLEGRTNGLDSRISTMEGKASILSIAFSIGTSLVVGMLRPR